MLSRRARNARRSIISLRAAGDRTEPWTEKADFWLPPQGQTGERIDAGPGERYGLFHPGDPQSPSYLPGTLLVFVHGIRSDCRSAWPRLPQYLLHRAQTDLDVFGFEYPAKFLREASLGGAAEILEKALRTGFQAHYDHILFVAHSAGGLVVKMLLEKDLRARLAQKVEDVWTGSISRRTQAVINLAVPHRGGCAGWTEVARQLTVATQELLCGLAYFFQVASVGALGWGKNEIFSELRHEHRELLRLEDIYVAQLNECDRRGWARPISYEVLAESEVAATPYKTRKIELSRRTDDHHESLMVYSDKWAGSEPLRSRGTHTSAYSPKRPTDLIVKTIDALLDFGGLLETYRWAADSAMAAQTKIRIETNERKRGVERLLGEEASSDGELVSSRSDGAVASCWRGGQAAVYSRLRDCLAPGADEPQRLVVTGSVGVGKTITLRRLARDLAAEHLKHSDQSGPLPLFFPLGQMIFDEEQIGQIESGGKSEPAELARVFTDYWLEWANKRLSEELGTAGEQVTRLYRSWIESRLARRPFVIILDGVDEFLTRHSRLSVGHMRALVEALEETYRDNGRLTIVLGVRSSQTGLASLARTNRHLLAVANISVEEAQTILPGVSGLLKRLRSQGLAEFLLTPLIITNLNPRMNFGDPKLLSRAGIIEAALEGVLEWNKVEDQDLWLAALTLIGWQFFRAFKGAVSLTALREDAMETLHAWQQHLRLTNQSEDAETLMRGFAMVTDESSAKLLATRTVLNPTVENYVAFTHQEWEDFLASRYLALCVRHGLFEELRHRAFPRRHFKCAGELLHGFDVTEPLIDRLLARSPAVTARFITGNFVGLLGNSRLPITVSAVRRLIGSLDALDRGAFELPGLTRHVTLTLLCFRAFADESDDDSDLRAELKKVLPNYSTRGGTRQVDPLTASMAWCYRSALAKRFEQEAPASWPGLSEGDATAALPWVCDPGQRDKEPSAYYRSLQLSYLDAQPAILVEPARAITNVHYLYLLAVAAHERAEVSQVKELLPELLLEDGEIAVFLKSYTLVPELNAIFLACQRLCASRK
jgi:hypothetical protein